MEYDFELGRVRNEIKRRKARRVLVQLPEGLKSFFPEIAAGLESPGVLVALCGDACFGACDFSAPEAFDLVVHYGHTEMVPNKKVLFVPSTAITNCLPVVRKALRVLPKRVGIITTVQHSEQVRPARRLLEKNGRKVFVASGSKAKKPGQVLGCDFSAAAKIAPKVDAFLFIGSGRFHPLGAAYFSGKRVFVANPFSNTVEVIENLDWEKEKWLRKEKAADARSFGVVVCSKPGQRDWRLAESVLGRLNKKGKKASIVFLNEITPEKLDYLPFDAFVITACPRLVLDDWKNYKKPVLLPDEF